MYLGTRTVVSEGGLASTIADDDDDDDEVSRHTSMLSSKLTAVCRGSYHPTYLPTYRTLADAGC